MNPTCFSKVAGMFYPSDPTELTGVIVSFLKQVALHVPVPKAIISPHAGYRYSGPIAASAFACLKDSGVRTVVILGPSHRFYLKGMAITQSTHYATPLGEIPIDQPKIETLLSLPQVHVNEQAYQAQENSIETQLPFLQVTLKDFNLIPILIGEVDDDQVAEVIDRLWDGNETLIVVSSDLSHYYDYQTAERIDKQTAQAILDLDPTSIQDDQACGGMGVRALLQVVMKRKLKPYLIDLRNSGDIAHSYDQVVGYGAFHFR